MKWCLCFHVTPEKIDLNTWMFVCIFLYDAWPFLTCEHSPKIWVWSVQTIYTYPSILQSLYPPKCFQTMLPLNHARTNHSWSSLFNLQSMLVQEKYVYVPYAFHWQRKGIKWECCGPSQGWKKALPTRPSTYTYVYIYQTASCPDWKNERWKGRG